MAMNLKRFAEVRTDIFGGDELDMKKKVGRRRRERRGGEIVGWLAGWLVGRVVAC